jgi:hypothetical protein
MSALPALPMALLLLAADGAAGDGWKKVAESDGIVIQNRERPGSDVKEVLATGTFDAPPARVHKVLDDLGRYQEFMPYTKTSHVLKASPDVTITYERINAPLVDERDYTLRVTHEEKRLPDGSVVVKHMFTQSNKDGPPPVDGVVRVQTLDGWWELTPADGGTRTKARYWVFTSPGGNIPGWAVNLANENAIPNLFAAVKKALKDKRYD